MRISIPRVAFPPPAVLAAVVAACLPVRGDDVVVEDRPGAGGKGGNVMMRFPDQDLGQMFDSMAFPGQGMPGGMIVVGNGQVISPEGPGQGAADPVAAGLAPVRRRAEARIATVDRIVGLSEPQRKKLQVAAETDLRRLADTVGETRARYAGRKVRMNPRGGFDEATQKTIQECQQDAARCRELVLAAGGRDSLLAKVVVGALDPEQGRKYEAVLEGRRACRWKAVVAAGLDQWDDILGLTQRQHAALEKLLLADPPTEDDDEPGVEAGQTPAGQVVGQRLAALGDGRLAELLDPRQRAAVAGATPPGIGGGMLNGGGVF